MQPEQILISPQRDQELNISVGQSRTDTHWHNQPMTYSKLLQRLNTPTVTQETHQEFMAWGKAKRDERKDVGGFVGGYLKKGRRKAENVQSRSLVTLDADFPDHNLWEDVALIFPYAVAMYSTHSYSERKPRVRLIIPLKRVVTPDEYEPIARKLAERFGMNNFDDTTYQAERLMYWPSHSIDGEYVFNFQDDEWIDPDEVLAEYEDWKDSSFWPMSDRVTEVHKREAKRQGDPLTKKGVIGAFNRTYDIRSVIEKYLSDVYEPTEHEDRYTYIQGSTSGGLVLYDDKFAYSHHSTDPVGDQLCNAFDLVRIHKFGDLDDEAKPGTPVTRLPSQKAMEDFAMDDKAVYKELLAEKREELDADFGDDDDELPDWLTVSKNGQTEINTYILGQHVLRDIPCFYNGKEFLYYEAADGIWHDGTEEFLKGYTASHYLKSMTRIGLLREVIQAVQTLVMQSGPFPETAKNKIVLENGVLDVATDSFTTEFSPDIHARTAHPVKYDPDAKAPLFDGFIKWLVGEDNAPFIYEWLGYCFYRDYPVQKMLFLYGRGGSGKSTLLNLMRQVIGRGSYSTVSLEALMTGSFATAHLYQKTANFDNDAKPEFLGDASLLKTLTGEDSIYADVKFGMPIQFENFAKLTFAMNSLPPMRDFSGGLERRAIIIRARSKVTDDIKQKYPLKEMAKETAGIFNAAIEGLKRVLENGHFTETETMHDELRNWLRGNDQIARFIEDSCEIGAGLKTPVEDMYNNYSEYAYDSGEKSLGRNKFNQRLEEMGYERKKIQVDGKRSWNWLGIKGPTEFD